MVIGDINSFAIECIVLQNRDFWSTEAFGHLSMWADRIRIGDFEEVVMLSPLADALMAFAENAGRRNPQELFPDEAEGAMETVLEALFTSNEYDIKEVEAYYDKFSPFLICPNGSEAFDGWIAITIEGTTCDRFIWRDPAKNVHETILGKNEQNLVIRRFVSWLDEQEGPAGGH